MLAGIRYPLSFTNLILIEEGTLALQKHYVNLNHYDTNIIHLIIVGSDFLCADHHRDGYRSCGAFLPGQPYMPCIGRGS